MKKMAVLLAVALVALAASKPGSTATKGEVVQPGGITIAVVDLARALNEVNEGKKAKANLEGEFKAKKSELDKMKNDIQSLREDLERKSHLLSQEALKEKRDDYQRKFMEYQQKAKEYTEQMMQKEGEMTNRIVGKLRTVVEQIAQKSGYTFVLEKSQGGVVYGPVSADITTEVIKQYNK